MNRRRLLSLFLLGVILATPLYAGRRGKGTQTAPGKYVDWADEIDELEIVEAFKLADYKKIVVLPFDTASTPLPEANDNTYAPVKRVLSTAADPFIQGLRAEFPSTSVAIENGEGGKGAGTLLLKASVVEMDPGSRAARYWAGFGAGAARTKVNVELVDAATGKTLVKFTQERRSGIGAAGGGYEELLDRNLHAIGEDAALIFKNFP